MRAAGGGLVHVRDHCVASAVAQVGAAQASGAGDAVAGRSLEDARCYATWARLEREFALGGAESVRGGLLLPRHSRARFMAMVEWMGHDASRRALLPVVRRATSIYTAQTQLTDWGAGAGVAARIDALLRT